MPPISALKTVMPAILSSLVGTAALATDGITPAPTLIEVWRVGDDGLTVKLGDAIEAAFRSSPEFELSTGNRAGTLVVAIPTNVHWSQVGTRIRITYSVDFSSAKDRGLGASKGSCWASVISNCAQHILYDAKQVTRMVH